MRALEHLRAARALIANPENWTRGAEARDAAGRQTDAYSCESARWCALGALIKAAPTFDLPGRRFLSEAARVIYGRDFAIAHVNDEFGHAAVLRMYDRAIEMAEAAHG